jgi:hypothetical protein
MTKLRVQVLLCFPYFTDNYILFERLVFGQAKLSDVKKKQETKTQGTFMTT